VTVAYVSGTGKPVFSFDAAVASSINLNGAVSGYAPVTVSGMDFGMSDQTVTAGMNMGGGSNAQSCSTSSWTSATTAMCTTSTL
jgi:hypothetical protein